MPNTTRTDRTQRIAERLAIFGVEAEYASSIRASTACGLSHLANALGEASERAYNETNLRALLVAAVDATAAALAEANLIYATTEVDSD